MHCNVTPGMLLPSFSYDDYGSDLMLGMRDYYPTRSSYTDEYRYALWILDTCLLDCCRYISWRLVGRLMSLQSSTADAVYGTLAVEKCIVDAVSGSLAMFLS